MRTINRGAEQRRCKGLLCIRNDLGACVLRLGLTYSERELRSSVFSRADIHSLWCPDGVSVESSSDLSFPVVSILLVFTVLHCSDCNGLESGQV